MTWQVRVVRGALALGIVGTLALSAGAGWLDWFIWSWL
jgi:hypothetical protein